MPSRPARSRRVVFGRDFVLDDRIVPADFALTGITLLDGTLVAQPNPVYGQMVTARASYTSSAFAGTETAVPIRITANFPANYFGAGSAAQSFPLTSSNLNPGTGSGSGTRRLSGWYAGTAAFTITATVDPNNQVAETNESNNSTTVTVTPVTPTDLPAKFVQPISTTPNREWSINNYADVDPRSGTLMDYRGGTNTYDGHDAIDAGPAGFGKQDDGVPIVAAAGGTVTQVVNGFNFDRETVWQGQDWNAVYIDHGNGWETVYGHLAAGSITVEAGDDVTAGQVIGLMGSSGNSTGVHLHSTAFYRGSQVEAGFAPSTYWVNPLPYTGDVPGFYRDAGMTTYNPSNDLSERAAQAGRFGTSDTGSTQVYFYVRGFNLKTTDVITWHWVRPNGTVGYTANFSPTSAPKHSTWWWTRPVSDFQGATGTWQVVYYLNGTAAANEQRRASFQVVSGAGGGTMRVADSAGRVLPDGRTTPVDFGTAAFGAAAVTRTFTVNNPGVATISLSNSVTPLGFAATSWPSSLAPGASGTITVEMNTNVVGEKFGTLRFQTTDAVVGTYELNLAGAVTGTVPAGSPNLDLDPGDDPAVAFNLGSAPRRLAPLAVLTDPDSANFNNGTLTVEFASFGRAEDRLSVRNQGNGGGQIGVSNGVVTYGNELIGGLTTGTGTTPLTVSLTSGATVEAVQALIRNLTYENVSATPVTQRKAVRIRVSDGTGRTSNLTVRHVVNTGLTRNPTLAGLPASLSPAGGNLSQSGSFTDPWGTSWSATVNYGTGAGAQPLTLNANKTFTLSHSYGAGSYTLTVTVTNNLGGTATATIPVTVSQGSQTITFNLSSPVVYGVAPITLTATGGGSGNPVTFSLVSGPGSVSGSTLSVTGAGSVVVRASQAGNASYAAATPVDRTLVVNPKALTVTIADKSRTYGQANPALTFTVSGLVGGDPGPTGSPATVATATSKVGSYAITQGSLAAPNGNYTLSVTSGSLSVTPASLTVTANDQTRTTGQPNPPLTYQTVGLMNGETAANVLTVLATTATAGSGPGEYPITAGSLAANTNYALAVVPGKLTVTTAAAVTLSNSSVFEFRPAGATVGTLDASAGVSTYALVAGTGDADNARFAVDGTTLRTAIPLNRGASPTYSVRIRATSTGGTVIEQPFTITATDDPALALVNRRLTVAGTTNADTFAFSAGATDHALVLNGVNLAVRAADVDAVAFDGGAGADTANLTGRGSGQVALGFPGSGEVNGSGYKATVLAERVTLYGAAGATAYLHDAAGDDLFVGTPAYALLQGAAHFQGAVGFGTVVGYAGTGSDAAYLYDSAGDDIFVGYPTAAFLQGTGYYNAVVGFDGVTATASAGSDAAYLNDSAGDDTFGAGPASAYLAGAGYYNTAAGFDGVTAYASTGNDAAYLTGSAGDDVFSGTPTYSFLAGAGFYNTAVGFDGVTASGGGGSDGAYLTDSAGDDYFTGSGNGATLSGPGYFIGIDGFAGLNVYGMNGGTNRRTVGGVSYYLGFHGSWL